MDLTSRTRVWRHGRLAEENCPPMRLRDYVAEDGTVVWLDLTGPVADDLEAVRQDLGLDPVAVEDAVSRRERAKLDRYADYLFLNVYSIRLDGERLNMVEVSAFITERALVTVHDEPGFDTDGLVARWDASPELAEHGVAYLLHGLLDLVVDQHFDAVQSLDDEIDGLEEVLFGESMPGRDMQRRTYELRKDLTRMRRVVLPMREVVNTLLRRDLHLVPPAMIPYYQDVYDHVLRATEWTDSVRDAVSNLQETRISLQGNHLNEVMKKLTGWAAIIAVPTFITGFYGENVPYPGFGRDWGLLTSLGLLIATGVTLYILFKRRDWL